MLFVAIVVSGIVFLRVQSQPTAVQISPTYYNPPAQPAYPQVEVVPDYPNRDAGNGHYHDRADRAHDQGR
jgi:hypothetical protein